MKSLVRLLCGAFFLPLAAFADPLVISAIGRGASETAAIAAAKRQAATDAQSAGFLPKDGYRVSGTRVIDVSHLGNAYVARVDAELIKDLKSRRVVFVIAGDESQTPRMLALVQRVRTALHEQRTGKQSHLEIVDALATGILRISSLADLQRPELDVELDRLVQAHRAEALYLLSASSTDSPVFLVTARTESGTSKVIRTLRDSTVGSNPPLTTQVVDAVRHDVGQAPDAAVLHSVVTVPSPGTSVRKGQAVILYADSSEEGGVRETSIVTHGIVTEVSRTNVRVLTDQPVSTQPGSKLRLAPLPKRGVVITESDW